ncbi:acyl carrier protein [Alteromonas australica]|uniref:Acyl carrier protein n=1 Tax=Alteromonas australica TaxID=589873 RepID=A0A358DUZ3_9ALTE|nr:acyl carrier protein [Alteromonas australica]MAF69548.1 acyl carrier protein [Alteromonas sp.]HAU28420.1 acyl carrier protein [Alteromonas australica]HBU49763.1 acyl carrier protein [Alteromonas australica]
MENKEKLIKAFTESLGIEPQLVTDELTYNTIPQWDSTAHMVLIAELENVFDVMLDTDDIIDLSSVAQAKIILQKYDDSIEFA